MKNKFRYKHFHIQYVYEHFCQVMGKYVKKKSTINELFDDVVKRYSVRSRYYHNMMHIMGMASLWDTFKDSLEKQDEVFLAIIYHDIVYNPKRSDNEQKSAEFFLKKVVPLIKISQESYLNIFALILATKHNDEFDKIINTNKDMQYLLDFDLETLGTRHKDTYEWYRTGVRKEYKMYSDEQYKTGRKAALESFLKRKQLYFTKDFKKIEKNARKNLQNEINLYLCES